MSVEASAVRGTLPASEFDDDDDLVPLPLGGQGRWVESLGTGNGT